MFDFIGDIHGHADQLQLLFQKLGYVRSNGMFRHPDRKAFFLGDFVNRGAQVRRVLEIVRPMVEANEALAVVGNHEYNLLAYLTDGHDGNPLREHSESNFNQLKDTLSAFERDREQLYDYVEWMGTLPLFFENNRLRVVHACWDDQQISFIKNHYSSNKLTDTLLQASAIPDDPAHTAVQVLLKGVEFKLSSQDEWEDADGNIHQAVRLKWWEYSQGKGIHELSVRDIQDVDTYPDEEYVRLYPGYPATAPPVFIGHYCLDGTPRLLKPNVCCVDFCVYRSKRIVAYRWHGEQTLSRDHLVW